MTSITAQSLTLEELFSGHHLFTIPYYQRPFAWDEAEANELLDDFLKNMGSPEQPLISIEPYFLGTMVVSQTQTSSYLQVVDGQQRLTTLTILFVILRALLLEDDPSRLTDRVYSSSGLLAETGRKRRLTLRDTDDIEFFARTFQDATDLEPLIRVDIEEQSDSQQRLTRVARYFQKRLTNSTSEQLTDSASEQHIGLSELRRLRDFMLARCIVILVSAYSNQGGDSAFTVFTVLNKRGADLTNVDILKAEILGRIQQEGQVQHHEMEQYAAPWEDLEQRLGRDGMAELINYTRIIRRTTADGTILSEFRRYVIKERRGKDLDKVITEDLAPLGDALATIREMHYFRDDAPKETIDQLNELFGWLNRLENSDWLPPAIYFLSGHHQDATKLLEFFKLLERLAVYLMFTRADANVRSARYRGVIEDIRAETVLYPGSRLQLERSPKKNEVQQLREKLNKDVYTIPGPTRKYLLLRLDGQFPEGQVSYTIEPTVEHVLPQNPSQAWLTDWNGCWNNAAVRKRYTNSLANLVLLSGPVNVKAADKSFQEKKRIYFPKKTPKTRRTPFHITVEVLQSNNWSLATVEARQSRLLGILYDLWDLGPVTP